MERKLKDETNPGVYLFKRNKQVLYIGSTGNLDIRPIKRDKGHENRFAAITLANQVELIPCQSLIKAQQLEEQLVSKYRPIYNLRNPRGPADLERTASIVQGIEDEIWAIRAARMANPETKQAQKLSCAD